MNVEASPSKRLSVHDLCVATGLFAATALWVVWQNSRVAVLWDLGYLLNTSHRIALGQLPYRDFSLVHPPLTFEIQAVIERLFGRHYECVIAYAAIAGGLASVLTWRIILEVAGDQPHARLFALLLSLPLPVLGVYSVYPHPIYDSDATLAVLASILLLQSACRSGASWWRRFAAGAGCALPLFVKQNIGLPYLAMALAALLILFLPQVWKRHRDYDSGTSLTIAASVQIAAGCILALGSGLIVIQLTCGLGNYLHWTVRFAAQRRLPAVSTVVALYSEPTLLWTLPLYSAGFALLFSRYAGRLCAKAAGIALIAAPYLALIFQLGLERNAEDRADRLLAFWPLVLVTSVLIALSRLRRQLTFSGLLPFLVLAAIHGTFLSQEVWGSTYAIWPLLLILMAYSLATLPVLEGKAAPILAAVMGVTLLVCGGLYAASLERLDYIYNPEEEPLVKTSLPALRGMAARGPYLPDFEQLVRFADAQIPACDGTLLLPGEEPFFYATGRAPQFPAILFDHTTDPYTPEELVAEADRRGIRWVVVKTRLQSNEDPLPEREQIMQLIGQRFLLVRRLDGYDVYRRR